MPCEEPRARGGVDAHTHSTTHVQGHREKALGQTDTAETVGGQSHMPLMPGQSRLSAAVSSGHREFGPDSGSSQGGQEEDGWQPVSSLATATHQPRGLGPAPLRKQPALPYSGRVRRGRHFLRAERERARSIPKQRTRNTPTGGKAGFCGQELAGLGFVPGVGGAVRPRVQGPRRQQSCRQGAGEEARSRQCPPVEQGRGAKKRRP